MENAGYVFAAFAIVWIASFVYILALTYRQRRLWREIESLKGTLKEGGTKQQK